MVEQRFIPFGKGAIIASSLDFVNGYQAGHLAYMTAMKRHPEPYTDTHITELFLENLESMTLSSIFAIGYAVGWLNTLATKGVASGTATEERG
jgi:hypothetical protein